MKSLSPALASLLCLLCPTTASYADLDDPSYSMESQEQPSASNPFKFGVTVDAIRRSDLHHHRYSVGHLKYTQTTLNGDFVFYYDECLNEGAMTSLGWSLTQFKWNENPFFDKSIFHTATLALSAFSGRCSSWFWQGRAAVNISTDHFDFGHYATYDILLWGRYQLSHPDWRFHIGFLTQAGMKADRIYPIIGLDWTPCSALEINLVFPMNISILYSQCGHWKIGAATRFFSNRFRFDNTDRYSLYNDGITEYRATGFEGVIAYDDHDKINTNLHIGYMATGKIKISDKHHENAHWCNLEGAPYIGGELAVKF